MGLTRKVGGKHHMMHGGRRTRKVRRHGKSKRHTRHTRRTRRRKSRRGRRKSRRVPRRKSRRSRGKRGGSRKSALRSYRRRVRGSKCRKKGPAVCRALKGCKYVSKGKKRSFCRKRKNTHRK